MTGANYGSGGTEPQTRADSAHPERRDYVFIALTLLFLTGALLRLFHVSDSSDDVEQGSASSQILWTTVYAISGFTLYRERIKTIVLLKATPLLVVLVSFLVVSTIWSVDPLLSLRRSYGLVGSLAFSYFVVMRLPLRDYMKTFAWSGFLSALASFLTIIISPSKGVHEDYYAGAWHGIFPEKNALGSAMAVTILATVPLWLGSKGRGQWAYLANIFFCLLLLVKSQSMTSLLVLIAAYAVYFLVLLLRSGLRGRIVVLLGALVSAAAVLGAVAAGVSEDSVLGAIGRDATLTGRAEVWEGVQTAIASRPLLGFGYATFWRPDGEWTTYVQTGWRVFHSHNGFFELTLDGGMLAVCIFLALFVQTTWKDVQSFLRSTTFEDGYPLAVSIFFILRSFSESAIAKYNDLYWITFSVAAIYAAKRISEGRPALDAKSQGSVDQTHRGWPEKRHAKPV